MKRAVYAFRAGDVVRIRQRCKYFYNKIGHGKRYNKGLLQAQKRTPKSHMRMTTMAQLLGVSVVSP